MTIKERQQLRINLLKGLYDWHFSNNGLQATADKKQIEQDTESNLAYDYLSEKGFIQKQSQGLNNIVVKITTRGIDYVESLEDEN